MKKQVFHSASNKFTVNPAAWDSISNEDVARMFDSFFDWMIANEEGMTFSEATKAWGTASEWANYLKSRNAETLSRNYAIAVQDETQNFEEFKKVLFMHGHEAVEDFLRFETEEDDKNVLDDLLDQVYEQMPEDIYCTFVQKYT